MPGSYYHLQRASLAPRPLDRLQSDAALVKRVAKMGAQLKIIGPVEFGKIIEADRQRYGRIVAEGNLAKPN
jgi:hypothetical protein